MNLFTKVALLAVVVALCVDAVAEARRNRSNRRNHNGRRRNTVKIADWLKNVTELGLFGALHAQNQGILNATENVKKCKKLFHKKTFRYTPKKNRQELRDLRDILQRMTSFRKLLRQAKECVDKHGGKIDKLTRKVLNATKNTTQAIKSFVKNVTATCVQVDCGFRPRKKPASMKEKKRWRKMYRKIIKRRRKKHSKYSCTIPKQPCKSEDLQDHQETLKIISTQLNNFLNRLISPEHVDVCAGNPPGRKKKGKSSPEKKELKAFLRALLDRYSVTSWNRSCQDRGLSLFIQLEHASTDQTDSHAATSIDQHCPKGLQDFESSDGSGQSVNPRERKDKPDPEAPKPGDDPGSVNNEDDSGLARAVPPTMNIHVVVRKQRPGC